MPMIYNAIGLSTIWEIENEEEFQILKDLYTKSSIDEYEGKGIYCKFNYLTAVKGKLTSFIQKFSNEEMKDFIKVADRFRYYITIGESNED